MGGEGLRGWRSRPRLSRGERVTREAGGSLIVLGASGNLAHVAGRALKLNVRKVGETLWKLNKQWREGRKLGWGKGNMSHTNLEDKRDDPHRDRDGETKLLRPRGGEG